MLLVSSVVCPVSGVLSSPPSPLSPSFLAAKNILLMSVTIQLKKISYFLLPPPLDLALLFDSFDDSDMMR